MKKHGKPVSRRIFLGMTSLMTLKSLATGQRTLASPLRREFTICFHTKDGSATGSVHLDEVFDDLTKGIVLEQRRLSAVYHSEGHEQLMLQVRDEETGDLLGASVKCNFRNGVEDVHLLYAEALRVGVQMAPEEPYLVRALGDHYMAFQQYTAGISCFKELLETRSNQPQLLFQLGMLYERGGHKKEAYTTFRTVHHLDPGDPVAIYNLGVLATEFGHRHEAENWFLETLARDPDMEEARTRLDLLRKREYEGVRA
jgi:tetratricopeptide (TPR) repeat protein